MNAEIPDKIIAYNIYTNGVKLGVTGKVDTPEFKMKTSTMSGAGVGGEIEVPTLGQWEKTEHEIPLTLLGEDLAELLQQGIEEYKTWQRTMGRDIDPAELIARIKNAGAKRVRVAAPIDVVTESAQIPKLVSCSVVYGGLEDD